jgi:hypothetical protein
MRGPARPDVVTFLAWRATLPRMTTATSTAAATSRGSTLEPSFDREPVFAFRIRPVTSLVALTDAV